MTSNKIKTSKGKHNFCQKIESMRHPLFPYTRAGLVTTKMCDIVKQGKECIFMVYTIDE